MENMEKKAMDILREENEGKPKTAGKLHIESFVDGEKKEERDHECDGFVVMAFTGEKVAIDMHGCCIAQMAAAIDVSEELSEAAMLVTNRRAKEKMKDLLRGILKDQEGTEE